MAVPDWTKTEDWDALYFGDKRVPGVPRVEVTLPTGLDLKKGRGRHKARAVDKGAPPAEVRIEIELQPSELAAFEAFVPLLRPRDATQARPKLEIAHPQTSIWGIASVMVGKVSSPHPRPGGTFRVQIEAHEAVEQPKKVTKPSKVVTSSEFNGIEDMEGLISRLTPATEQEALQSFDSSAGLVSQ